MDQIFGNGRYEKQTKRNKIGGATMKIYPKWAPEFKLFTRFKLDPKNFQDTKYKVKIKFDKLWVCQNVGLPKWGRKNSNFLTIHARQTKFSGLANIKKSYPNRGSPKFKLFNLLKWIHKMVVHKFSTFLFQATFAFLHHQLLSEGASPEQA